MQVHIDMKGCVVSRLGAEDRGRKSSRDLYLDALVKAKGFILFLLGGLMQLLTFCMFYPEGCSQLRLDASQDQRIG